LDKRTKTTTVLLAVALDNRAGLQHMVNWISLGDGVRPDYTFLSDAGHLVANRYGLWNLNLQKDIDSGAHAPDEYRAPGEAYTNPATFVIDCEGLVRWKYISSYDQRTRPTKGWIKKAVAALPKPCSTNSAQR